MSSDLKAKLAQVAARMEATRERLCGLERSAASLRQDLEQLRGEAERGAEPGTVPADDEWDPRVPTRTLAMAAAEASAAGADDAAAVPAGTVKQPAEA